jgi:hypothetical protein
MQADRPAGAGTAPEKTDNFIIHHFGNFGNYLTFY